MSAYQQRGQSDEWYTPAYVFDALGVVFDMDVAGPMDPSKIHTPCAAIIHRDSLETEWFGFVWMNPPFGHQKEKRKWLHKFFEHGCGIALMPDRTSAPWFQEYAPKADRLLFVSPKIKFERPDGTRGEQPGDGTVLMGAGELASEVLERASKRGLGMVVTGGDT